MVEVERVTSLLKCIALSTKAINNEKVEEEKEGGGDNRERCRLLTGDQRREKSTHGEVSSYQKPRIEQEQRMPHTGESSPP